MSKILYALQYHKGDQKAAMALARLMADIIPEKKCADADMMFAASANADYDFDTIRYCARRFASVRTFRCVKDINGWPAGPNNQAHETARYFAQQCQTGRWKYTGILMGEPDCVPLRRDVFALLNKEWQAGPPTVLGPWVTSGPPPYQQHINGNSIFGPQFIYSNPQIFRCDEWIGWDAANAGLLLQHGRASLWMHSDYQLGTPQNPWKGCDHLFSRRELCKPHPFWKLKDQEVAYLHGVKRWDLAQACVREKLLGEKTDESKINEPALESPEPPPVSAPPETAPPPSQTNERGRGLGIAGAS